jgi:hypothetical protein
MASKKSRTTFNKVARERELRERRELKREKKEAARIAKASGLAPQHELATVTAIQGDGTEAEPGENVSIANPFVGNKAGETGGD